MATQTIQFDSLPTADLDGSIAAYVIDGSDTALASLTESSLAGRWTGTLTDHTAGDFELIVSDDSGIIAMYWVRLLATTGTYIAWERGDLISETINGKLTTERLALIDGAMQTGADGDTGETLSDQLDVIELISGSPSPNEIIITASNFGQDGETLLLKEGSS